MMEAPEKLDKKPLRRPQRPGVTSCVLMLKI